MSALNRSQDQKGSLSLSAREPFGFAAAARSHGWCSLAPFSWDEERGELSRVEELKGGVVVLLRMRRMEGGVAVEVESGSQLTAADLAEIREKVGWMLRLDEDLSEFYELCRNEPCLAQVIERKQGRLLRAPTLFEDVVKTVLTTNTTWPQTKGMVARLVATLGRPFPPDPALHAFPSPRAIAEAGEKFLAREVRLGYRAPLHRGVSTKGSRRGVGPGGVERRRLRDRGAAPPAQGREGGGGLRRREPAHVSGPL